MLRTDLGDTKTKGRPRKLPIELTESFKKNKAAYRNGKRLQQLTILDRVAISNGDKRVSDSEVAETIRRMVVSEIDTIVLVALNAIKRGYIDDDNRRKVRKNLLARGDLEKDQILSANTRVSAALKLLEYIRKPSADDGASEKPAAEKTPEEIMKEMGIGKAKESDGEDSSS